MLILVQQKKVFDHTYFFLKLINTFFLLVVNFNTKTKLLNKFINIIQQKIYFFIHTCFSLSNINFALLIKKYNVHHIQKNNNIRKQTLLFILSSFLKLVL